MVMKLFQLKKYCVCRLLSQCQRKGKVKHHHFFAEFQCVKRDHLRVSLWILRLHSTIAVCVCVFAVSFIRIHGHGHFDVLLALTRDRSSVNKIGLGIRTCLGTNFNGENDKANDIRLGHPCGHCNLFRRTDYYGIARLVLRKMLFKAEPTVWASGRYR